MKTKIVLGLAYGDEGKGMTTDYLCQQSKSPLVVRFSGGHQAGHTVVLEDGTRHVFSSFGAGTLRSIPSYWSKECTLYPIGFFNELSSLLEKGIHPEVYIDALAQVTTPYDVLFNRKVEKNKQHGSCGLGFGATVARNRFSPYRLYAKDLFFPDVCRQKLKAIQSYYEQEQQHTFDDPKQLNEMLEVYLLMLADIQPYIHIVQEKRFFEDIVARNRYSDIIFEGSQGILLDMDHGFFPNVTHAPTTSKNAMQLIQKYNLGTPEIYYVTRAYQTRHGNGYLSNEHLHLNYTANSKETNQYNTWQGEQRCTILDIDMLNYALQTDANYHSYTKKNLVMTCLDQLNTPFIEATSLGDIQQYSNTLTLAATLSIDFDKVYESRSDCSKYLELLNLHPDFIESD